jgi:FKBP-type peptidyl-prolyl cis-trans isomerase FklB
MRIEMKLIHSAFLVATLLALNASAQSTPPTTTNLPPPTLPQNNHPALTPQPNNHPVLTPQPNHRPSAQMPPGLARGPAGPPPPMPDKDKLSYAIGWFWGNQIKRMHVDLDSETTIKALKAVLADQPTSMDEKEVQEILKQMQKALPAKLAAENKAKGDEFMAKNAKDPAVKTLTNGIQYKVIKEGTGPIPKPTDTVVVAYKGTLVDGTTFDQKTDFTNAVSGRTIKGWTEALLMMHTGSKWEVVIPPDLGYGMRGYPPKIGPDSTLIYEMELIEITAPPPAPAKPLSQSAGSNPASQRVPSVVSNSASSTNTTVVSGQIIKVPSAEDIKKGAKIEVITNVPNQ